MPSPNHRNAISLGGLDPSYETVGQSDMDLARTSTMGFDLAHIRIQQRSKNDSSHDQYEKEANILADEITNISSDVHTNDTNSSLIASNNSQTIKDRITPVKGTSSSVNQEELAIVNPNMVAVGGKPLQGPSRTSLEERFGFDLSKVRIHQGDQAHKANEAMNSFAFTYGEHIWLDNDASTSNLGLITHEIVHVFQQLPGNRQIQFQKRPGRERNVQISYNPEDTLILPGSLESRNKAWLNYEVKVINFPSIYITGKSQEAPIYLATLASECQEGIKAALDSFESSQRLPSGLSTLHLILDKDSSAFSKEGHINKAWVRRAAARELKDLVARAEWEAASEAMEKAQELARYQYDPKYRAEADRRWQLEHPAAPAPANQPAMPQTSIPAIGDDEKYLEKYNVYRKQQREGAKRAGQAIRDNSPYSPLNIGLETFGAIMGSINVAKNAKSFSNVTAGTQTSRIPQEYFDEAMSKLDKEEFEKAFGAHLDDLTSHAQSSAARAERGITGQSAHISARSAMRIVEGYDPKAALTRILDVTTHRGYDAYWNIVFRQMAQASGGNTITVDTYFSVMSRAITNNQYFSGAEAKSMIELLKDELFVQHGLRSEDLIRLPYSK